MNTSLGGTAQLKPVSASENLSSTSPFTLLLLGSDSDSKFKGDYLTQSMILTRVDPATKHVTMLSIPRDLWVRLCTGDNGKIDQAFLHGGAQCAIQTVRAGPQRPHRLLRMDRAPGTGVCPEPARRGQRHRQQPGDGRLLPRGSLRRQPFDYQRILVLPGAQHMSGTLALEYVRARHDDAYGDFARSQRQQQILIALRAKTKHVSLADIPSLATSLGTDFQTDMSIGQVSGLLPIAGSVPLASITQVVLLPPYTSNASVGGAGHAAAQLVVDHGPRSRSTSRRHRDDEARRHPHRADARQRAGGEPGARGPPDARQRRPPSSAPPARRCGSRARSTSARRASIYAISGSTVRRLALPAGGDWTQPRVLPDGSLLVIRRFDAYSDLYHVSAAGRVLSRMTADDASTSNQTLQLDHWVLWPAISPDGTAVYFATDAPKPAPNQSYEVDFSLWSAPLSGAFTIGDSGVNGGTRWSVPDVVHRR